jgi:hypothetical protein
MNYILNKKGKYKSSLNKKLNKAGMFLSMQAEILDALT